MKATTVKLEGQLLEQLEALKPKSVSVSAFVREALWRDIRRRKMADGAAQYETFLESNPEEREWANEWEQANLASPPRSSKRR